jgi:hypothetical protein
VVGGGRRCEEMRWRRMEADDNDFAIFVEAGKGGWRLVEMNWQPVRRLVEVGGGGRRCVEMR